MKIRRVKKNGRDAWMVHWKNPSAPSGYSRSFFGSRVAADTFARDRAADLKSLGSDWMSVPPGRRADVVAAMRASEAAGISLMDAVSEAVARRKDGPGMTVGKLFAACLESKRVQGLRARSIRDLAGTLNAFAQDRSEAPAASITPTDVETWLAGLPVGARRRLGHLVNLRTGFSHGVRLDVLEKNPCAKVPRPVVEARETAILTPEQTETLFRTCERDDPEMLGFLALAAFAGFRPESEVARMTREMVEAGLISGFLAPPTINKTRRRRLVPVSPNLREWLTVWLALGVPLAPAGWDHRLLDVRRAAGLDPWPQNALRHSRVSYRLAQTGNAAQTAIEDGHSEAMLHAHYSALVTPEAAERYFGIRPSEKTALISSCAKSTCLVYGPDAKI